MESTGKILRYRLLVQGRVQGVFFRENVKDRASELSLLGWVRNHGDKVEIIAEGEKIQLDRLYQFCKEGPDKAQVTQVEVQKGEPTGEFDAFQIRY
jgi:acylphosphatase